MAYQFEIGVEDKVSGPATAMAKQLRTFESTMTATQKEGKILENELARIATAMVKAKATGNIESVRKLGQEQSGLAASLKQLEPEILRDATAQKSAGSEAQALEGHVKSQADALAHAEQAQKGFADQTTEAQESAGKMNEALAGMAGVLLQVAEIALKAAAAIGAVILAGAALALHAVEAKEKLTTMFDALGEGKISGADTLAMLDELGEKTGQTREQLAVFTKQFLTMGISGKEALESLTLAAASADAITEGGGAAFTKLFSKIDAAAQSSTGLVKMSQKQLQSSLKASGLSIDDVAQAMGIAAPALEQGLAKGTIQANKFGLALQDAVTARGAGPLAEKGRSLGQIWAKFQENITKIFENVDVKPFLAALQDLVGIFDMGTASGKTMGTGVTKGFNLFFQTATKIVPYVKHFFQDLIIWSLEAYIAIKPLIAKFQEWYDQKSDAEGLSDTLEQTGNAISKVASAVIGAIEHINALYNAFNSAKTAISDWITSAKKGASDFIDGLVGGLTAGYDKVVQAVKGLADKAKNALKGALDSHSPSRVMMEIGAFTTQGFAQGLTSQLPAVHAASTGVAGAAIGNMAATPAAAAAPSAASPPGSPASSGSKGVEIGSITITMGGGGEGGGGSALELTEQAVTLIFERIALAQGL